jgi:hypothetical protein
MVVWWICALILLFVVLPLEAVLLNRIVTPVDRIRKTVDDILYNGVILTGELDNLPAMLAETDATVHEVGIGATRYAKRAGGLAEALGV